MQSTSFQLCILAFLLWLLACTLYVLRKPHSGMDAAIWNERYGAEEYAYGKEPNVFIRHAAATFLQEPCVIAELAAGEGRNAAYLAQQGHIVHAVDFSQAGLDKTRQLAEQYSAEASSRLHTHLADIFTWQPPELLEAVVLSFCHVLQTDRPAFMASVQAMLKPGGVLINEVFHPDQIAKGYRQQSGGPHDVGMMVTLQEMRALFSAYHGTEQEGAVVEYELREGRYHHGLGAVTRYVWRKAADSDS